MVSGSGSGAPGMAPSAGMDGALPSQARRPFRAAGGRVDETLAVAMQPDHFAPERGGFVEKLLVRRQRNAQAGPDEIGAKAGGEGRMGHHSGDIGDEILGADRRAMRLGQRLQHVRAHVRLRRLRIGPQRINTAGERAFVVIVVGNQVRQGYGGAAFRRCSLERRHKNLLARPRLPQLRIRAIDQPIVRYDPLPIETAKVIGANSRASSYVALGATRVARSGILGPGRPKRSPR